MNTTLLNKTLLNKAALLFLIVASSIFLASCGNSAPSITPSLPISEFNTTFEAGTEGWESSFLGYTGADKDSFNFKSGVSAIPDLDSKGLMFSANNINGQLVMYAQKQLSGLEPNQEYNLLYVVGLASNLSSSNSCIGFEGKRTELKVSASLQEPKKILEENLDILNLGTGPFQRVGVVGHKDRNCEDSAYAINQLGNLKAPFNAPVKITSDANGTIWTVVVLDSSFEGESKFYIDSIDITATPVTE